MNEILTAGAQLRAARKAAGIHIAALAGALKVPVARLEALEADRFDLLPDAPFVRALAGSICRVLKLDPAPVLARLPQRKPLPLEDEGRAAPAPALRGSGPRMSGTVASAVSRPMLWAVLLLLAGALGLVLVPSERWSAWKESVQQRLAADASGSVDRGTVSTSVVPSGASTLPEVAPAATVAAASTSPSPSTAPDVTVSAAASAAGTQAPAAAGSGTSAVAAVESPAAGLAVFQATGDSWIKVTDARGTVVLQKLLTAGTSQTASGETPLTVVVGRADATQVQVRGKPFDLTAISRNNVARFEVK